MTPKRPSSDVSEAALEYLPELPQAANAFGVFEIDLMLAVSFESAADSRPFRCFCPCFFSTGLACDGRGILSTSWGS